MNSRIDLTAGIVSASLVCMIGLAWALSPLIYASSIESAVRASDLATLARRIDALGMSASATDVQELVPAGFRVEASKPLDDSIRRQINDSIKETVGSDPAFIQKLGNLLSGNGMVTRQLLDQVPQTLRAQRTPAFTGESGSTVDTYILRIGFRETGEQVTLVLERKGWFTWRAAKLAASSGSALWPLRSPRGN